MPRYQRDASWFTIEVEGSNLIVTDRDGGRVDRFGSEEDAEGAYDDYVLDALSQGYRLVEEPEDPKRALEAAILADPDDVEAHLVYADLLMSRGDPRGELIALDVERRARPEDADARNRTAGFLKEHRAELYGDFEELIDLGLELEWRLGFIHSANLEMQERNWNEEDGAGTTEELAALIDAFLAHPSARFLRSLSVHNHWHEVEDEGVLDPIITAISQTEGPWDALSSIELLPDYGSYPGPQINNGDLLFTALPALRSLRIRCGQLRLRDLGEPSLERLMLEECVSESVLRAIGDAHWKSLRELDFSFAHAPCGPEHLRLVLDRPERFPQLSTLRLRRANFTDEIVDALIAAPGLLERLELLDLSGGSMTDGAARALVKNALLFPALKLLDVSSNRLETDTNYDLRKLPCKVVFGEQNDHDNYDAIQE